MTDIVSRSTGATVRPTTWRDFDAVLALIAARTAADYGEPMVSADHLREAWRAAGPDMAGLWVAEAGDEPVGYGELQREDEGSCFLSLYLADSRRHQAAGAEMIRLAEACAGRPMHMVTRVAGGDPGAQHLFEAAGYGYRMSFLLMEIVLSDAPPPPARPVDIEVRPFVPGRDDQAAYRADEEASEDKGYHAPMSFDDWAARMSLYREGFDPSLWFLAWSGDRVAGVALNFIAPDGRVGWVDHLGVRRAWRGQGLGLALLLHSFDAFFRRGIARVRLSVDSASPTGAPRLYERAGMHTVHRYHIYARDL